MRGLRPAILAAGALILLASPLSAQPVALTPGPPSGERGLIPRYRFHLAAESLAIEDARFDWDADFGGDLDLVDYGLGRITALANYEVMLGEQLQQFDPNQGNYTLDVSVSARWRTAEFAAVFHHMSRHLSDRPKQFPIDWNMVGLRASYDANRRATHLQIDGRALWTVARSFVDYDGELGLTTSLAHDLNPRVSVVANAEAYLMRVDGASSTRSSQNGGRVEGGLRIAGSKGVVEFIAGYERRVDADPFEGRPLTWGYFGFRLLSAS
jgi:hypothetical protein